MLFITARGWVDRRLSAIQKHEGDIASVAILAVLIFGVFSPAIWLPTTEWDDLVCLSSSARVQTLLSALR